MPTTPVLQEGVAGPFWADWQKGLDGGSHTGAYPQKNLGLIGERGIRMIRKYESEDIPADLLGASVIDAVHIGMQVFLEFELEEWNRLTVQQVSHPFTRAQGVDDLPGRLQDEGEVGIPGTFYTDKGGSLLLTPAFHNLNSAGLTSTPVYNFGIVTLAPGFEVNQMMAARRRVLPVRLRAYPYLSNVSNRYIFFEKSALP